VNPSTTTRAPATEERCACGNLVAKITREGVEILCRRCKRVHRIPWPPAQRPIHARGGREMRGRC
jgi:phage FluMu protein Com